MKSRMLFAIAGLLLVGCEYESPFTTEHSIVIDSAVLGLWEPKPDEGKEPKEGERMMILKYSDTEYLIHYPAGEDGIYYRGYPIKIGGISCVQLQIIGTKDGPPRKDEADLFYVVSYQLTDSGLEIKTLNTNVVDDDLKSTEELHAAFLKHKENKDLFNDPEVFRRKESAPRD
ncbi:MAG: hypothetical protein MUC65_01810 [Pontiellaceae bacterium]|jgi:hypothetical protein|nr:hypothetical protein [Pontiellaceae bacterium]